MKPRIRLDETTTPDGGRLTLSEHDGDFVISLDGQELMHSKAVASEALLGSVGAARLNRDMANHILIGGLGLGFTLKSVLESVGPETTVEVAELIPAVIEWNRTHLLRLNGRLLEDARVTVEAGDVGRLIGQAKPQTYDAILLDVDNGPCAMVATDNASLYSDAGIRSICAALKPGGRAVVWSAGRDSRFENRLRKALLKFEAVQAKTHERAKRASYLLYVIEPSSRPNPARSA